LILPIFQEVCVLTDFTDFICRIAVLSHQIAPGCRLCPCPESAKQKANPWQAQRRAKAD